VVGRHPGVRAQVGGKLLCLTCTRSYKRRIHEENHKALASQVSASLSALGGGSEDKKPTKHSSKRKSGSGESRPHKRSREASDRAGVADSKTEQDEASELEKWRIENSDKIDKISNTFRIRDNLMKEALMRAQSASDELKRELQGLQKQLGQVGRFVPAH